MSACPEYEPLLLDDVAGALAPEAAARLEAHRRGCAACRAEGALLAETLALLRLPPPEAADRRAAAGLAASIGRALRRRARARTGLWIGGGLAAAGVAAALLLAPPLRPAGGARKADEPATARAAWQAPDPDSLWSDADLFGDEDASSTTATAADVAVAALER